MNLHIQCMNINIYVDVASDPIILPLIHLQGFADHNHMFDIASHSLGYDPESKLIKASQNKLDVNLRSMLQYRLAYKNLVVIFTKILGQYLLHIVK